MNINETVYNKQEVSIVDVKSSNIEEAFLRGRGGIKLGREMTIIDCFFTPPPTSELNYRTQPIEFLGLTYHQIVYETWGVERTHSCNVVHGIH